MATSKCISANAVKNTGSATIAAAGAIPTSDTSKQDFSLAELNTPNKAKYGTAVTRAVSAASSGNLGTIMPLVGGTFAAFNKNQYIMQVAGRYINGTATTLFQSPASRIKQVPNYKVTTVHTAYLTALSWTGGFDGLPHYTTTVSAQAPSFGADRETTTLGQFAYRTGKPTVVQADYTTQYSV